MMNNLLKDKKFNIEEVLIEEVLMEEELSEVLSEQAFLLGPKFCLKTLHPLLIAENFCLMASNFFFHAAREFSANSFFNASREFFA